jgi:hypothetical protein
VIDGVIIDPGPQSTEDALLKGLDGEEPTAPHLVNPERLVASAGRLYGGDEGLRRLWGEILPVPAANLRILKGGERDVEGEFSVEYTPGHASHHVSYFHEQSGCAFCRRHSRGADAGARPHARGHAAAGHRHRGLGALPETIAAWQPSLLALTHFGPVAEAEAQLERCRAALPKQADLAARTDRDGFVAAIEQHILAASPDLWEMFKLAAPPDQLYLGLDRWRRKRAETVT